MNTANQNMNLAEENEEFDHVTVHHYLRTQIEVIPDESLNVTRFSEGMSNLTYLLQCGEWEAVLRRPPSGPLPPKAHNMKRESELLLKLHPVFPYVPKPYVFCEDESIIGVPFYVMERKKGLVFDKDFPAGKTFSGEECRQISYLAVDKLVDLHNVNIKKAGLEQFGRPDKFMDRQVHGWIKRYNLCKTEDIPAFERLAKWLSDHIPTSKESVLIHNDYKLNNMLINNNLKSVEGIVDWELATIADPLFDLGTTLGYWVQSDDPDSIKEGLQSVTVKPGFISREDIIERYAKKTNRDMGNLGYYLIFSFFRYAIAMQQMHYRWKLGTTNDSRFAALNVTTKVFMDYANEYLEKKTYLFK
ncbi:phosphotransferase family protein [Peribacillus frigoritolerans]|uniref:phosphotransferase family protein n=1 Tax=Peribacillus frigoritolerans TaxID=450367 RepID=UPI0021D3B72E|nr:phosphotransferase family protein [Peribacillus frigoritolerans]MCU6598946.1 phosphotransferase family protein [Peribacillus frigoritolerans]